MSYKNAKEIFPPELLNEIQKYVQGEKVYIPRKDNIKSKWGQKSGAREELSFRNSQITKKYEEGLSMEELSQLFCLSYETIRKIIYKTSKNNND